MPTRFTSPASPRADSSAITKSSEGLAGAGEPAHSRALGASCATSIRQVAPRRLGERVRLLGVDGVGDRLDVLGIGPESIAAAEIDGEVNAETRAVRHREIRRSAIRPSDAAMLK